MNFVWIIAVVISLIHKCEGYKDLGDGSVESIVVNPGEISKREEFAVEGGDLMVSFQNERNAMGNLRRWINGTVPYVFDATLLDLMKIPIQAAFDDFHKYTCIRFRPKNQYDRDWVVFRDSGTYPSCGMSCLGRFGVGGQTVLLGSGCEQKGTAIHELMHTIESRIWFDKYDGTNNYVLGQTFGLKYDYGSILHYHNKSFSLNGRITMYRKDGLPLITQTAGLSDYDIVKVNVYYGCDKGGPAAPQDEFTTTTTTKTTTTATSTTTTPRSTTTTTKGTTTVKLPPLTWGYNCITALNDPSCDTIGQTCDPTKPYHFTWAQKGTICTRSCYC